MAQPNAWTIPLRLLVEPTGAWRDMQFSPSALPAFVYHSLTMTCTWLLNAQLFSEVAVAASIGPAKEVTAFTLFAITLQTLASVAITAMLLAVALWGVTRLFAPAARFRQCWILSLNGSLPLAVGWLYGSIMFFFVQPLAKDLLNAMSLLLKPYSLGLITLLPGSFKALTLPWFFAAYFDLFGIWSIVLISLGLLQYLRMDSRKLAWAALLLVLLLALIITGLWQVVQMGIASAV